MATSMRPALATAATTARSTEASLVTSSSRTCIGSESFSASERISVAFLVLRPPGSRIVAKTVWPLRAKVSVNSLPNPVLEPVMRTTCLEFIIIPPCGNAVNQFDAGSKAVGYKKYATDSATGLRDEVAERPCQEDDVGRARARGLPVTTRC